MSTVKTETKRTVCYTRVSSQEQATEGFSLSDQQRACGLYAQMKVATGAPGWSEIADDGIFIDAGVSGTLAERPALSRLLAAARAGTVSHVIVTKMDRLARSLKLLLTLWDELESYGVNVTVIEFGLDTSTAVGKLIRNVLGALAEFEHATILGRTSAGKAEALRQGSVYRPRVLGYRYIRSNRKAGQLASIEVDAVQASLVRRIFDHVAAGGSLNGLAKELNEEQVPTLRGASYWRVGTLRKIIANPLYQGRAAHGRMRSAKTAKGTNTSKPGDPDKIVYVDCPPIISPDLAAAAQAQLVRNKISGLRPGKPGVFLLGGGLLRCGVILPTGEVCNSTMNGETRGSGKSPRYRCGHQTRDGFKRHTVLAKRIESTVWDALRRTLADTSTVLDGLRALSDASSSEAEAAARELRTIEQGITTLERQRDALLDLHLAGRLDAERWSDKDAALLAQRADLANQHARLTNRQRTALAQKLPLAEVEDLCRRLAGRLDRLDFAGRYHLVHTLFSRISTDQSIVTIEGVFDTLSMNVALDKTEESDFNPLDSVPGTPRTESKNGGVDLGTALAPSSQGTPPTLPFALSVPLAARSDVSLFPPV